MNRLLISMNGLLNGRVNTSIFIRTISLNPVILKNSANVKSATTPSDKSRNPKTYSKKSQLKPVVVKHQMTIRELADSMKKPTRHIVDCLEQLNYSNSSRARRDNYLISNFDLITKIVTLSGFRYQQAPALERNFEGELKGLDEQDEKISKRPKPSPETLVRRSPVVTIMGHVDHGKTTLLDALRGTKVVESEFGGITQHIGAFNVTLPAKPDAKDNYERNITFLDTPGHAAFSMMRSRGARITDIVVLVIAAEDSIMAQTVESIQHAKSTGCPIIVAINKIDKSTPKQIEKVKQDLLKYELIGEDMGGDTQIVPISALKKTNLDLLKEEIWTRAEIMELKGDPKGLAEGYIVESTQDIHRGKLATVLFKRGTVNKGSYLVAGTSWCKVKFMFDEHSSAISKASLSQAVQIMGWKELPNAGDEVLQVNDEAHAKKLVDLRLKMENIKKEQLDADMIKLKRNEHEKNYKYLLKEKQLRHHRNVDFCFSDPRYRGNQPASTNINNDLNKLSIIIKTDVNGSLEAILDVLETYDSHDKVILDLVDFEVGPIKQSDIELSETFNAIIYCFNLPESPLIKKSDKEKLSRVKNFNVIYQMFDDLKSELEKLTLEVEEEEKTGEADVLAVFDYKEKNKTMRVIGGRCMDGLLDKQLRYKVIRNDKVLVDNLKCKSLKHFKTDVNTIKKNVEFGLSFDDEVAENGQEENEAKINEIIGDIKATDKIICYRKKMVKPKIDWNLGF